MTLRRLHVRHPADNNQIMYWGRRRQRLGEDIVAPVLTFGLLALVCFDLWISSTVCIDRSGIFVVTGWRKGFWTERQGIVTDAETGTGWLRSEN
jgi:hypothetical protein